MWRNEDDSVLTGHETLSSCSEESVSDEGCEGCSEALSRQGVREFMAVTKALADEHRVRILLALELGELCVCQIVELMGLATSTISKHMSILKQAGLVDSRKQGRWMYYRRADDDAPPVIRNAIAWMVRSLGSASQVLEDKQRLATICSMDPRELCVSQDACDRKCK